YCSSDGIATPDGGATFILPRVVGFKKAMELALLGERFDARQALEMGLVNRVAPADALEASAGEWIQRLAAGPRFAYGRTKALLYGSLESSFSAQVKAEEESFKQCAQTADFAEGITAFMEKRKAKFE
ncbi:MAG TPA: enoyl-CoA hydratase-related protein, partial [Arenicellales bacterium]|nr:enoyl-CoA hydratase-related protein [Arenicellales bacterium]